MTQPSATKQEKIEKPASNFDKPDDIVEAKDLSVEEKKKALETWEQNARQLFTASNEGMSGDDEGTSQKDHNQLAKVIRAKAKIGEKPKHKPSH